MKIKAIGRRPTLDLEVDHPKHAFLANGVPVSNSHAIGYASYSYQFAYAKAHFPRAFFVAKLKQAKHKPEPFQEIRDLVDNANSMGIEVCPPSIEHLNLDFTLVNNKPTFGLTNIKNVGSAVIIPLRNKIRKDKVGVKDLAWHGFLMRYGYLIKKNSMESLILSGALDLFQEPRAKMLYEFMVYYELRKKDKELLATLPLQPLTQALEHLKNHAIQHDRNTRFKPGHISDLQDSKRRISEPPYVLKDSIAEIAKNERELLGINITCSAVDEYDTSVGNCTCMEFIRGKNRKKIVVVAQLDRVSEYTMKRGKSKGKNMAFVSLRDTSGLLDDCVIFSDILAANKAIIVEGNIIVAEGRRDKERGSFMITKVGLARRI